MRPILAILAATSWISVHEFLRNQVVLIDHWTGHYQAMGLTFPGEPLNGAMWGMWALCFSIALFIVAKRSSLVETTAIGWLVGFVLMWIVVGNLGVLPFSVLPYAIPWSLVEVLGAVWIVKRLGVVPVR